MIVPTIEAMVKSATDVVTAELDILKSHGPSANIKFEGVRKNTLEKAWEFLGRVFEQGMKK